MTRIWSRSVFNIAPVKLNLSGKDPDLVGLGSFDRQRAGGLQTDVTNREPHGVGIRNHQHQQQSVSLIPEQTSMESSGPILLAAVRTLGRQGRNQHGAYDSAVFGPGLGPNIITRNLTPDPHRSSRRRPYLAQFLTIIQTGHDYDKLHLNCGGSVATQLLFPTL